MEPMHTWLCARVIRTTHTYRQHQGTCKHEETGCEELNFTHRRQHCHEC